MELGEFRKVSNFFNDKPHTSSNVKPIFLFLAKPNNHGLPIQTHDETGNIPGREDP